MKAAIAGTGLSAGIHAQALRALGCELAAVVGSSTATAAAFAGRWDIPCYGADLRIALEAGIDCLHICTPPALHDRMAGEALRAGRHVVCEKPLCLDPAAAKELAALAREKDLVGSVVFNVRFHEACREAREYIGREAFGQVLLAHGSYLQEFHVPPDALGWRYQPHLAGPMRATTEIGSHWIDLVRYWTGLEIVAVAALFGRFHPERFVQEGIMYAEATQGGQKMNLDSEDAAAITLKFSNGAIGNLLLSEVSHGRSNRLHLEVTGSRQSLWWTSEDPCRLHLSEGKFAGVRAQSHAFGGGFTDSFRLLFEEVYTDIRAGKPSANPAYPTFDDGYLNAAVCAAVYESATGGSAWVDVKG